MMSVTALPSSADVYPALFLHLVEGVPLVTGVQSMLRRALQRWFDGDGSRSLDAELGITGKRMKRARRDREIRAVRDRYLPAPAMSRKAAATRLLDVADRLRSGRATGQDALTEEVRRVLAIEAGFPDSLRQLERILSDVTSIEVEMSRRAASQGHMNVEIGPDLSLRINGALAVPALSPTEAIDLGERLAARGRAIVDGSFLVRHPSALLPKLVEPPRDRYLEQLAESARRYRECVEAPFPARRA